MTGRAVVVFTLILFEDFSLGVFLFSGNDLIDFLLPFGLLGLFGAWLLLWFGLGGGSVDGTTEETMGIIEVDIS